MRICEARFALWSTPSEQNASAGFLLARDQSVSENYPMISVATALGLKIVSRSVVVENFTRASSERLASRQPLVTDRRAHPRPRALVFAQSAARVSSLWLSARAGARTRSRPCARCPSWWWPVGRLSSILNRVPDLLRLGEMCRAQEFFRNLAMLGDLEQRGDIGLADVGVI